MREAILVFYCTARRSFVAVGTLVVVALAPWLFGNTNGDSWGLAEWLLTVLYLGGFIACVVIVVFGSLHTVPAGQEIFGWRVRLVMGATGLLCAACATFTFLAWLDNSPFGVFLSRIVMALCPAAALQYWIRNRL